MSPEMGCAHLSSFTSLRRPPDPLGSTIEIRVAARFFLVVVDQDGGAFRGAK